MADDPKTQAVELLRRILDQAAPIPAAEFHKGQDRKVEVSMLIESIIQAAVQRMKTGRVG
jgi:hypothetical protein